MKWTLFALSLLLVSSICYCEPAKEEEQQQQKDGWTGLLECVYQPDLANCLESRSVRALQGLLDEALDGSTVPPQDKHLAEELSDVLAPLVPDMEEEEEEKGQAAEEKDGDKENEEKREGPMEEGRGKKKKKKRALMKIVMFLMLLKNKISLLFGAFSAFLQIKFFGIAVLNLLFSLFRLYLELTKNKQPQKVIYYEHAQHQHHYEHEHHYDDENKGSWGGLWGRSITDQEADAKKDAQNMAYTSYRPRQISK